MDADLELCAAETFVSTPDSDTIPTDHCLLVCAKYDNK